MSEHQLRCAHCNEPLPASMGKSMTVRPRGGGVYHYCERDACRKAGVALAYSTVHKVKQ